MPFIQSNYKGNRWNKNKHLETMLPALFRKVSVSYKRERVELADGDFIDLDWVCSGNQTLLILFHGLEGSSQSQYIKGFVKHFSNRHFDVCVMNFRSCSGENNRLFSSYHMGKSDDVNLIIEHILNQNNYKHLVLGGFSLGGNVLLKYLGENANHLSNKIKCAFAFSVPIDLASSSKVLSNKFNRPYMFNFLKSLNKKIMEKSKAFPNQLDIKGIERLKTFEEWDSRVTAKMHGFKNAQDYYNKCNSLQFLPSITLPTLLVNALNDPFLTKSCFPIDLAKKHEFLHLETPKKGGHVGFSMNGIQGNYYSEIRAFEFVSNYIGTENLSL